MTQVELAEQGDYSNRLNPIGDNVKRAPEYRQRIDYTPASNPSNSNNGDSGNKIKAFIYDNISRDLIKSSINFLVIILIIIVIIIIIIKVYKWFKLRKSRINFGNTDDSDSEEYTDSDEESE